MLSRHDTTDDNSITRMPITRDGSLLLLSPLFHMQKKTDDDGQKGAFSIKCFSFDYFLTD